MAQEKSKSGKRVTREQYERLTAAYLEREVHAYAAMQADVEPATAKIYWDRGNPRKGWPAIKLRVMEMKAAVRAELERKMQSEAQEERDQAERTKKQAIRSKAEEAQLTELARAQLLPLMATIASVSATTLKLAGTPQHPGVAQRLFETELAKLEMWLAYDQALIAGATNAQQPPFARPLTIQQLDRHMLSIAGLAQRTNDAARTALELHRLYLGEPTDILQLVDDVAGLTREEFDARRQSVLRALGQVRQDSGSVVQTSGESAGDEDPDAVPTPDETRAKLRMIAAGGR